MTREEYILINKLLDIIHDLVKKSKRGPYKKTVIDKAYNTIEDIKTNDNDVIPIEHAEVFEPEIVNLDVNEYSKDYKYTPKNIEIRTHIYDMDKH